MTAGPTWSECLRAFHGARAGTTEDVLARAIVEGVTPCGWSAEPLSGAGSLVVDVACGSGPLRGQLREARWVGLDQSTAELGRAADNGASPLVQADVARLPVRPGVVGAVVCSMALMIVEPLDAVLAEVARVLAPGGVSWRWFPSRAR